MILHIDDPGCCAECPISSWGEYGCQVLWDRKMPKELEDEMGDKAKRPSWCPLEPEKEVD